MRGFLRVLLSFYAERTPVIAARKNELPKPTCAGEAYYS